MSYKHFRPKSPRYGVEVVIVESEKINSFTSAGTDTYRIPTPYRRCFVERISAQCQQVPIVTTGTSTATVKLFRANGGATVTISSGLDLETLVANKAKVFVLPTTTTDGQRVLIQDSTNGGDTLFIDVVNGTTIATPPTALYFVVELLVLE